MLLAIRNLSSAVTEEINPWDFEPKTPEKLKSSKPDFIRWCQKPDTKHCHFSAAEGLDPLMRTGKDNPVTCLRGLVADFDAKCSEEMLADLVKNSPTEFPPNWASLTFSHGARLVWLFHEPLIMTDNSLTKSFLKIAAKRLGLSKFLPGFDAEAFYDPCKYYERGSDWRMVSGDKIPTNMLWHWMYEAGNRRNWDNKAEVRIPLEDVEKEVMSRFPGKWQGNFEDGARGHRFWDESASNDTAAVVRATGMQCFTGGVGFVTWREILGRSFVEKYQANTTGAIVSNFYFDGRNYWNKDNMGCWRTQPKEDVRLMLKVKYALKNYPDKSETSSEVDKVLYAIQEQKFVNAALPFIHQPPGLLTFDNNTFLNTSAVQCLQPSSDNITEWGDGFPWLAEFFDGLFEPKEQLKYLLSWWKHFYENGLKNQPRTGQALFIAGDTNAGKTLLSTGIISRTVGGHADASAYLLGEDRFTSHVIGSPIMSVDDTMGAADGRKHTRYSAMIKKITANRHQMYEEKFVKAGMVEWLGRVVVTCNQDPESLRLLPNVDISILDKIMMLRCASRKFTFPEAPDMEAILSSELPKFCRWLLNWDIPEECVGDARFGVKPYHDKHLYNAALQTSGSYSFFELLEDFLEDYEASSGDDVTYWEGTATQLVASMRQDERISSLAAAYSPTQAASLLGQLKARGFGLEKLRNSSRRMWRIPFNIAEKKESK